MKNLTDSEKEALSSLLYLVTHHDTVNMAVLSNYSMLRVGNPGMPNPTDFAAILETLYAKSCA
jgi:hypothetical protein